MGLQAQLEIAGAEVERAHARLAALEMERERAAAQVRAKSGNPVTGSLRRMLQIQPMSTSHCNNIWGSIREHEPCMNQGGGTHLSLVPIMCALANAVVLRKVRIFFRVC